MRRLLRDSLVYLLTGEERYRQDALTQIEALFDPQRWPQWLDFAHEMFQADLRTGQLGAGVALTYDWLYEHLSAAERTMIVEGLDRCAIRPYLATVPTDPHWLTRPSNWMTVVVGGLGIVGMVLGSDHDRSDLLGEIAQPRMERYLTVLGPNGEFNESVGYSGSMQYPVRYFAARHSVTGGQDDRLAGHPFPQFCRWLMHVTVPPGHTIPFGDSHAQGPLLIGYFGPIAAAARDGLLQWFMETHGLLHDPAADLTQVDVVDLLWYDPTLAATPPVGDAADDSDLPLGAAFSRLGRSGRQPLELERSGCRGRARQGRPRAHSRAPGRRAAHHPRRRGAAYRRPWLSLVLPRRLLRRQSRPLLQCQRQRPQPATGRRARDAVRKTDRRHVPSLGFRRARSRVVDRPHRRLPRRGCGCTGT